MLAHTQAYLKLKEQVQAAFDFAVVMSHAVPALKRQIALFEKGTISSLPKPDYFPEGQTPTTQLKQQASDYKRQLSSYLFLSNFSFFESFVIDVIKEMIAFHGGLDKFVKRAEQREKFLISSALSEDVERSRRILTTATNPDHGKRYKKHAQILADNGYRFPSEMFSAYGIRMLVQKIGNLRSKDIPDLLIYGLHMDMSETDVNKFHEIRDMRNKIAHGAKTNLDLRQVSEMNDFLRVLSKSVDQHLLRHYFVSEEHL